MASAEDDLAYLSPSFDPASLTMPRLRNILMLHDISYPASAKKPQLIDIFTQELKPKARKILAARDRVRRTSRGITDMPSSQEGTVNGDVDDDDGSMLPPPVPDTPRQRKPRKSTRQSVEPTVSGSHATTKTSNGRRSSSKHSRQSDTEPDSEPVRPSVRKSRKSEATPMVKVEDLKDKSVRPPMRGGIFSNENPFQSGSSPSTPGGNERKSSGISTDKKKDSSSRRKTEGILSASKQQDGIVVPNSKTFEVPMSRPKLSASEDEPNERLEAGEEFTAEEELELVRGRAANGEVDILPPRKRKRQQKTRTIPKSAPWVVLMALLGGYATWWRQEKLAVGYCGIDRPSNAPSNVQIPEWAEVLHPTCEPCPQHAICYQAMETTCEHDFLLRPHPLSLGGLVPLPPSCEPDGEKARRVKAVADRALEELRERRARAECGTLKDSRGKDAPAEIQEEDLKREVGKKRRRNMDAAEFEDLWKGAIGEIIGREEVVSSSDEYLIPPAEHTSASAVPPSPASPCPAPSKDLRDSRWRDIDSLFPS